MRIEADLCSVVRGVCPEPPGTPAVPPFSRPLPTLGNADSGSESENEHSTRPSRYVEIHRAYHDRRHPPAYAGLSPLARKILEDRPELSESDALELARNHARNIRRNPAIYRRALSDHMSNSNAERFPVEGEPDGLGVSPFTSFTRDPSVLSRYRLGPWDGHVEMRTVITARVRESRLAETGNPDEAEVVIAGGLKPRHFVSVTQELITPPRRRTDHASGPPTRV